MAGTNESYYELPTGVVAYRTPTVADLYTFFPDLDSFYDYYGQLTQDTIDNIKDEYNIDKSVDLNVYVGGEKAPISGTSLFQKIINYPAISSGDTALDAAGAAAGAGLINGFNALVSGDGDIYSLVSTMVAGGAGYELAGLLSVGVEAAVCAIVALLGYKIGSNVYEDLESHQWFQDLLDLGADWIANDDSNLADVYRKVLGVQYANQTYLDSRFYNAVKQYIESILPDYSKLIVGSDIEEFDSFIDENGPIKVWGDDSSEVTYNLYYRQERPTGAHTITDVYTTVKATGCYLTAAKNSIEYQTGLQESQIIFVCAKEPKVVNWGGSHNGFVTPTHSRTIGQANYERYTYNNKTVYFGGFTFSYNATPPNTVIDSAPAPSVIYSGPDDETHNIFYGQLAWSMIYGEVESPQIPDGLEPAPWQYPVDPTVNPVNVVIDIDETTVPFYPVSLPTGPSIYPSYPDNYTDITIIENPDDQILPYHIPAPIQPETNPTSNPDDNPSNPAPVIVPIVLPIGGGGSSGGQSPSIPIPTVFPPWFDGVSQYGGLYTVYAPTQQQLYDFGDFLWVKWTDASLPKIINNPFDGVISLHEIYATPGITGTKEITSGFLKSNVTSATVGQRYTQIDCGTVIVPENYQNYLDYSPYSKVYCFLPFIGLVQLNSDDIVGHAVNITYKVDSYSGACVAIITVAQSNGDDENYSVAMYQFEGNCAVQLPISGGSQASLTAGLWLAGSSAVGSIVNGVASTVSGNGVMDLLHGVSNAISDVSATLLTRKSDVQHSGNMSGNFGAMAGKKPYLIVKFPRQVPAPNYNMDYGYPAHRRVTIGQCTGYLRVREVNIISATATDDEKAKIEQLLKEGVYFE